MLELNASYTYNECLCTDSISLMNFASTPCSDMKDGCWPLPLILVLSVTPLWFKKPKARRRCM